MYYSRRSLAGNEKSIFWQVFINFGSVDEFTGIIGLNLMEYTSRMCVNPDVLFLPEFHNKRVGARALTCIMHKILGFKSWFYTLCQGFYTRICANNTACIALKDSILRNKDYEDWNPLRPGRWTVAL